ncbi:MAG: hypothetical protein ACPG4B_03830 [Cycloclasticus sp.]
MLEATAVQQKGRVSAWDLSLWNDQQIAPLKRIIDFSHLTTLKRLLMHGGRPLKGRKKQALM